MIVGPLMGKFLIKNKANKVIPVKNIRELTKNGS